jgi:hypothetical protein
MPNCEPNGMPGLRLPEIRSSAQTAEAGTVGATSEVISGPGDAGPDGTVLNCARRLADDQAAQKLNVTRPTVGQWRSVFVCIDWKACWTKRDRARDPLPTIRLKQS